MSQIPIKDRSTHSLSYQCHRPEQTLLYQIIERHYPKIRDVMVDRMRHCRQFLLDGCMQSSGSYVVLGKQC